MASKIDRTLLNRKIKDEAGIAKRVSNDLDLLHDLRAEIADSYLSAFTEITKAIDEELAVLASAIDVYAKSEA